MRTLRFLLLLLLTGIFVVSCDTGTSPTLPPATAGGGFIVSTSVNVDGEGPISEGFVGVAGAWQADLAGAAGIASPFNVTTDELGLVSVDGARAPAEWKLTWESSSFGPEGCDGHFLTLSIPLGEEAELICIINTEVASVSAATPSFSLTPNPVYLSAAPPSGTVQGSGFSSTYGMPLVQYYNLDGTLMGQENATSVNGTSIQISGFDMSQLPVGTYAAFVSNATSGGGYTYLGNGVVQVANGGVDLTGFEQHVTPCLKPARSGCLEWGSPVYDSGTVSITVNGVKSSVSYGQNSTTWSIAVALANAINANNSINSLVHSVPWVYAVLLNIQSGSGYSLSATATTNDPQDFPNGSFGTIPSGSTF